MNYNCERCGDRLGWREHQRPTLCERCCLRAEVERLRAALEKIRYELNDPAFDLYTAMTVSAIARAALAEEEA